MTDLEQAVKRIPTPWARFLLDVEKAAERNGISAREVADRGALIIDHFADMADAEEDERSMLSGYPQDGE